MSGSGGSGTAKSSPGRVRAPKRKGGCPAPTVAFRNFEREAELLEGTSGKRICLSDLFRPPVEILHRGTWESGREVARAADKWLLVNLQDSGDFKCQCLNRDVWSDEVIRETLSQYFIMCQVSITSEEGEKFRAFYHATTLPFIGILDPRTGGAVDTWPPNVTRDDARDRLLTFLRRRPTPTATEDAAAAANAIGVLENSQSQPPLNPDVLSEEEQMRIAIENSLRETQASPEDFEQADDDDKEDAVVEDTTRISLRLPDDTTELLTWPASYTIDRLRRYVRQRLGGVAPCKLIFSAMRSDLLQLDPGTSLRDAKLYPSAVLFVHLEE
ncbi:UBX domain-containing protein 7 [Lutzomyia longipalpis]|uniref:UBX domain-containing protein 7 n=1 Tax=Lutzomyia longipalpis TaxID=7200 RepID=UPI002483C60A|nr:UBX domain-containing protein 7 [Lutzomyia longipalpis]